jgi:uncharacterized protein (TIGR03083 family)
VVSERRELGIPASSERGPSGPAPEAPSAEIVSERRAPRLTDRDVEELLGAYALDAVEPGEALAVEAVLARRPDLAAEAARLRSAAAWLAASEAIAPPDGLRGQVLAAAASRRRGPADPFVDVYLAFSDAVADVLTPEQYDEPTANGLSAHDLVVHLAAQESLFTQCVGRPTLPAVTEEDIPARTDALIAWFDGAPLADAVAVWRDSVAVTREWAKADPDAAAVWRGMPMPRNDLLVIRAFESWTHADDLRVALGLPRLEVEGRHLAPMSELAARVLPLALRLADRARPGRTARLVLSGDGGGDWLVPMGGGEAGDVPDVTLTADVVDWCRLVADRISPDGLVCTIEGDRDLAEDLVYAAPVLATV